MRRQFYWIAELFIWLLILFSVSGLIMVGKYNYKKNFNTYQIFLPDVDGLINGSPVKMMGINIGYINQIDIVGEDVYVKFVITEKGVKIPKGSVVTVEFSGLGGSKSLEVYPPEDKGKIISDKFIIAQPPKRIHDSLGVLMNMFQDIGEIAYRASTFMDKVGMINTEQSVKKNISDQKSATRILKDCDDWISETQKTCERINKQLEKIRKKGLIGAINGNKNE